MSKVKCQNLWWIPCRDGFIADVEFIWSFLGQAVAVLESMQFLILERFPGAIAEYMANFKPH